VVAQNETAVGPTPSGTSKLLQKGTFALYELALIGESLHAFTTICFDDDKLPRAHAAFACLTSQECTVPFEEPHHRSTRRENWLGTGRIDTSGVVLGDASEPCPRFVCARSRSATFPLRFDRSTHGTGSGHSQQRVERTFLFVS
jgi:hypothetical protein